MNPKSARTVQRFSPEYIEQCQLMTPEQILDFVESFRETFAPSVLVSEARKKEEEFKRMGGPIGP
jgi:hypothetical protein